MNDARCPGCGARFPAHDGPAHEYMESSPGCWHAFGVLLAKMYEDPSLSVVHRLSVDAYAVQHPGGNSRQAIQSVGIHLSRLCLFLEQGLAPEAANAAMLRVGKIKHTMVKLERPPILGEVTVADVVAARDIESQVEAARRWARSAWEAWAYHHDTVRQWVRAANGG